MLLPGFLQYPQSQADMVGFLMTRGANPRQKLPFDPDKTVIAFAAQMKSPMLAVLEPPQASKAAAMPVLVQATPPVRHAARAPAQASGSLDTPAPR